MTTTRMNRAARRSVAGIGAAAAAAALLASPAGASAGYTVGDDAEYTRATYEIVYESATVRDAADSYLRTAVAEVESFTPIRFTIGRVGARTGAPGEIFVEDTTPSSSCDGVPIWNAARQRYQWDGCGVQVGQTPIKGGGIQFRMAAFSKPWQYLRAMATHELAHVLGLNHVDDTSQLMHLHVGSEDYSPSGSLKWGDRAGLTHLSRKVPAPVTVPGGFSRTAAAGDDKAFYVDSGGEIRNSYWNPTEGWRDSALGGQVRADSPLVAASSERVFYISANGRLANAWWDGGWRFAYLDSDGPVARAGSGLAYADGKVFYVGSDGKVANAYYQDSAWRFASISALAARPGSPLAAASGRQVFFVSTDHRVANAYWSETSGWSSRVTTTSGQTVRTGSGLEHASGHVFYVGADARLTNVYHDGSGWAAGPVQPSGAVRSGSPLTARADGDQVFFIGSEGRLHNAYWNGSAWASTRLTGDDQAVAATSGLSFAEGHVFFTNAEKRLAHAYHSGSWTFSTIHGSYPQ